MQYVHYIFLKLHSKYKSFKLTSPSFSFYIHKLQHKYAITTSILVKYLNLNLFLSVFLFFFYL